MAGQTEGLGAYLRARRGQIQPTDVGLPASRSRRTPGLRREELASLAGVSVDYLVRLEQSRAAHPSAQVLASLARALRLSADERDHLYRIAGQPPPSRSQISAHLTPGLQRLMDRLGDAAVGVFDAAWTLVAWNATWAALMGDPSQAGERERNLLWRHFTGSPGRVARSPEQVAEFEESAVADLRRVAGQYPDDPGLVRLVADLRQVSPRFASLWQRHAVGRRQSDRKTVVHPVAGPLTLDCEVLTADGSDLRVVVYTADPSSPDAQKLDLVRVVGLESMRPGHPAAPPGVKNRPRRALPRSAVWRPPRRG